MEDIKIKISVDFQNLDTILNAIQSLKGLFGGSVEKVEPVETEKAEPVKAEKAEPVAKKQEVKISKTDVQKAFKEKANRDNLKEMRELLKEFGVSRISEVVAEDYPAILEALEEIE